MPIRIKRERTKGWRMPPNTIYVGRGSEWGNPFTFENSDELQEYKHNNLPKLPTPIRLSRFKNQC
jgi:Domain of unknown function (DUF4326)